MPLKILVFSASYGSGHLRAAEAVIEGLRIQDPNIEITHLDFGELLNKTVNTIIRSAYIEMIRHVPRLWGTLYYSTAKISPGSKVNRFLHKLGRRDFLSYIKQIRPNVIICTYPIVAGILAQMRLENSLRVPVVTVVTDFAVHNQWIHPGVDLYLAGCQDVFDGLVAGGIDPGRIKITGIPVKPEFEKRIERTQILTSLKLNPEHPTCLIMGGGYGVLDGMKNIVAKFAVAEKPMQTIIVCGKDRKLFDSLCELAENAANPILCLGFVDNVPELMYAADLIITKAGGLTVSEALTTKLPLVIYKPIPGQEEENAHFVEKVGAGKIATNVMELEEVVFNLLEHPDELKNLSRGAAKALPGRAAFRAAEHVLGLTTVGKQKTG